MSPLQSLALACALLLSYSANALEEGRPAPPFSATLFSGEVLDSRNSKGQVVLIHFWATWCEPCMAEMGALQAFAKAHARQNLRLLAVSIDDSKAEAKAREIMKSYDFSGAFLRQTDLKSFGRIRKIPATFVIDGNGILQKSNWDGSGGLKIEDLESHVTPLLQKI